MRSYEKRLAKLETKRHLPYADIFALIESHSFYDEISGIEQAQYCEYIGIDRRAFEEINHAVLGDLHVKLRRVEAPAPDELRQIMTEIENQILNND